MVANAKLVAQRHLHINRGRPGVAARFLTADLPINLDHWDLGGLLRGENVTLYHGTTKSFHTFDMSKSRKELVDSFYGVGIFLTPSKYVADLYAYANRNIGFDADIIDDLRSHNPKAAAVLKTMYDLGNDAWDLWTPQFFGVEPGGGYMEAIEQLAGGVDPNTLSDVCQYIIGSKMAPSSSKNDGPMLFNQSTGMPDWVYNDLDKIGIDSAKYRPKVYTVTVKVGNTLVTANKSQARAARSKGYDCVVFHGSDLVDNVPEVAVFDPHKVRINHVEVI